MDDFFSEDIEQWLLNTDFTSIDCDDNIDSLLSGCFKSEINDSVLGTEPRLFTAQETSHSHPPAVSASRTRFALPKTNEEIELARKERIPLKTQKDTKYCLNLWMAWKGNREKMTADEIPQLEEMNNLQLTHWLSCFTLEVRKVDGSEYHPGTLHHICAA